MHDTRMRGETRYPARHAVVEPRSHRDDQIGMVDGHVGRVGAMHAHHAQPEFVVTGKSPQPHERGGHGNAQRMRQSAQTVRRVGHDDASQQQGPLRFRQHVHRTAQLVQVGPVGRVVAAHVDVLGPHEFRTRLHNVFGQIDQHGTGASGASQIERLTQSTGQFADVLDQEVVLGAWAGDAHDVYFLKGIVADELGGHLSRDDDHGDGIAIGCGYARHRVGGSRT